MRDLKWIGLALLLPLAACSNTPEDQALRALTEMERAEPAFALLREHEPQAHNELRALLEQTVRQGGTPDQTQLIQRGRMILFRAVSRRMRTTPDPFVVKFAAFVADQAKSLESNPRICFELLMGTAGDVSPYLSAEMQQRERELVRELLTTPGTGERPVATEEDGQALVQQVVEEAPSALGLAQDEVLAAFDGRGPHVNVCRVNEYLFRKISQMQPERGAAIFRLIQQLAQQAMSAPGA